MVERKKTGLAKARKRVSYFSPFNTMLDTKHSRLQYAWVKR